MKARQKKQKRSRANSPLVVLGAVIGTIPALQASQISHASERRLAALPVERRITLEPWRLEAALAHVKIWTPSETIPTLAWQDRVARSAGGAPETPSVQPNTRTFAIPPGSLDAVLKTFATLTGVTVTVSEDGIRTLPSPGVTGIRTVEQALAALLTGTGVSYRFTAATAVTVEIRLSSDAVQVSGLLPRVESAKYAAPIAETPQTIQVIPRATLDEQGATTLTEAMRNVPGITLQAGEGGGASNTSGDMFNMRGFSAANSIFVDGVRDDGLISRDVFNLEQIEVFSGPTGSDVGRTNAAGYINMATKAPQLEGAESGTLSYASGEQVRATVDINQPLPGTSGTFWGNGAIRVNALWQDGGIAGRDYASRESKAIAPSIAFGLNTPTRATLSGLVMFQDNLADYGLPAAASPVGPLSPTSIVAATPVDQTNYYGSPDYDYDEASQGSATLLVEHDFSPNVTLRNQARYNKTTREAVITSITNPAAYNPVTNLVTVSRQANERVNDIFSNQTNLSARVTTGRLRHELSSGMEITSESQFAPTLGGVGVRAPIDLNRPDVFSPVIGMDIAPTGALSDGSTDTVAFYVFDAFDLTARLRVTGGVRVEAYDTRSHAVNAAGVVTDLEGDGTLVSGKAGLVFRLNNQGNVYASFGSSATPPGSANFQLNAAAANQNNPNLDPQESTNYEIGTKWELAGGRLQLTGAAFRTDNTNVIYIVDAVPVPPIFNQDDGQQVRGAIVSAVGQIRPWWDINVSLQYLDAKVKSQNPAIDGNRLALTPEVSGNLWTTVRLPYNLRVGGGLRYTDATFTSTANTVAVPRYTVADLLGEAPLGQYLTLRLNVYNITDRVYIRSINNNAGRYNLGMPRAFLLSTAVRF
jgi:catecholate siderophore receptor